MDWIIAGVIGFIIGAGLITYLTRGAQVLTPTQREWLWRLETKESHLTRYPKKKEAANVREG